MHYLASHCTCKGRAPLPLQEDSKTVLYIVRPELRAGWVSCQHHRDVILLAGLLRRTSQDLAASPLGAEPSSRSPGSPHFSRGQTPRRPGATRASSSVLPQLWRCGYREPSERHVIARAEAHQPHSVRLAALHSRELLLGSGSRGNETGISGVSKPRRGKGGARARREGRPASETARLPRHPGKTAATLAPYFS